MAIFFAIFMRNLNDDEEMTEHIDDIDHLDLIDENECLQVLIGSCTCSYIV